MRKDLIIKEIIKIVEDTPIVFSTGYMCRIAYAENRKKTHFYMTGSMGMASCIAGGISVSTKKHVVAVDGDGSLLMNLSSLPGTAMLHEARVVHIIIDDGIYESTGGQKTPLDNINFSAIATACGYAKSYTCSSYDDLHDAVYIATQMSKGSTLIHCKVSGAYEVGPRIDLVLDDHARAFSEAICRTI